MEHDNSPAPVPRCPEKPVKRKRRRKRDMLAAALLVLALVLATETETRERIVAMLVTLVTGL